MEKKEIIENVSDVAGLAVGAAAGAGVGTAIAGPAGAVGGALAGDAIERVFKGRVMRLVKEFYQNVKKKESRM